MISQFTNIGQVALPLAAAGYALYKKDYEGAGWLVLSVVINQIGIEVLKSLFKTVRPNGGSRAFPSGHTAAAFLGPCFLIARYQMNGTALVSGMTLMAAAVGVGRVWVKAHWPIDVVGGALLGYLTSSLIPLFNS
jgi:membrane-associated phospholipid phosphatase